MEKIKLIGERIKTLREISGKTADETAKLLNVPKETYLKYEKGRADIPVSFIFDAARAFNTELTAILTGDTPKLHKYCVVRKGTAPFAGRKKEYIYGDLAYNFAGKKMEVFEVTAGGKMPK
ncbi:MAG TPA: helix-turn-helix transcriptional regulator, partial [Candidatus Goldiibacteriota bacterium]|nr:helix-turn-helix transcriptional regulator [Candidatus Goldiibacteriota bacterium]